MPWICSIYDTRPDMCRRYPEAGSFVPESCGFYFPGDGTRQGRCEPECGASCCKLPRMNGDPDGAALPEAAGGIECRYLTWSEDPVQFAAELVVESDGVPQQQPDTADAEA
jgi:hypothetical protein